MKEYPDTWPVEAIQYFEEKIESLEREIEQLRFSANAEITYQNQTAKITYPNQTQPYRCPVCNG